MSITEILKEKTKNLHDLTEEKFQSEKIFRGDFTKEDYQKLLLYNYHLINTFEKPVFELLTENHSEKLQLDKRTKLQFIQKDLAALAISENISLEKPLLKNEAEAIGMLYVMEGSTLGGNVIAKNLGKLENFRGVTFNYFGIYGEETGPMWKKFKQVMDENYSEEDLNDILNGAERAYHFLLQS